MHCKNITGMSNSVDKLKARHNPCHLHRLLVLVLHVHKDVTLEGHQEARHLVHSPQGQELPLDGSKYRRSHKTMTIDLSGSKSVCVLTVTDQNVPDNECCTVSVSMWKKRPS